MSSETKWTPGPWVNDEDSGSPLDVHRSGTAVMVCRVNESKRGQANAHLIAAAPELYSACEWALDCITDMGAKQSILDAMAKARGESNA